MEHKDSKRQLNNALLTKPEPNPSPTRAQPEPNPIPRNIQSKRMLFTPLSCFDSFLAGFSSLCSPTTIAAHNLLLLGLVA
jgi:hypothetical protein